MLELDELWSFVQSKAQTLWLWVALCRRTRQTAAWNTGRPQPAERLGFARCLAQGLPGTRHPQRPLRSLRGGFSRRTHRCCPKAEGETCHVERWFGTLRARVSRLVRTAYSFSKHPENYLDAIHFFITTYNLQIKQSTSV